MPEEQIVRIPALPTGIQRALMVVSASAAFMWSNANTRSDMREDLRIELATIRAVEPYKDERVQSLEERVKSLERGYRNLDKKIDALLAKEGIKVKEDE